MDLQNIIQILESINWQALIFKIVSILLVVGYLVYSLIYHQQIIKMRTNALIYYHLLEEPEETQKTPRTLLFPFSLLQLFIGIILLITSLWLL